MSRDEAEQILMAVEVGMSEHYSISRAQYLKALAIVENDCEHEIDTDEQGKFCIKCLERFE